MSHKQLPLLFITALLTLIACNQSNDRMRRGVSSDTDTLIDAAGRAVTIPGNAVRVISPFTMYTRLIVALGCCDKLVGISHSCVLPEEEFGCNHTLLELPDVGPFGANIELIASLKPDLIFASLTDVATFTEKSGATVIAVSFPSDIPMTDMFYRQIDMIGKALRCKPQADSLKQFIRQKLEQVTAKTAQVPEEKMPRVYFAWTTWTGDILNTVSEFDPIELAGGVNVAREAKTFAKGERGILVSREHIIKWNPDIIFISRYQPQKWMGPGGNTTVPVTIKDICANPLLQSVNAVKNNRIYYTTAFCNWWPHQRALVQILYMAKLFHPELFTALDVEQEGNEIFKHFYGGDSLYTTMVRELELYRWD